jgi:hypothetical protein
MPISKPIKDEIFTTIVSEFSNNTDISTEQFALSPYGLLAKASDIAINGLYDYAEQNTKHAISVDQYYGAELDTITSIINIARQNSTFAKGKLFVQGTLGTIFSNDSVFMYNNILYSSISDREIINNTLTINAIIRNGTIATVFTASDHNLVNNAIVTISNTGESNFNITASITVLTPNSFSIVVLNQGATSASAGICAFNGCNIDIISKSSGVVGNILGNVSIQSITVDSGFTLLKTTIDGVAGGVEQETDDNLRKRFYERIRNYTPYYTKSALPSYLKSKYSEITHAKVKTGYNFSLPIISILKDINEHENFRKITFSQKHVYSTELGACFFEITGAALSSLNKKIGYVAKIYDEYSILINVGNNTDEDDTSNNMYLKPFFPGQATIFVYKMLSVNHTYSNFELQAMKQDISNNVCSFVQDENDFFVANYTKKNYTFSFTSVSPNLSSIKEAIKKNLIAWCKTISVDKSIISESEYSAIINNSRDNNGNQVSEFSLFTGGNINLAVNEILDISSDDILFA